MLLGSGGVDGSVSCKRPCLAKATEVGSEFSKRYAGIAGAKCVDDNADRRVSTLQFALERHSDDSVVILCR